jgi:hypothetical protein
VKIAGFEVAAYWAELQSILKQVVKKQTADEQGFFSLDRSYIERETTLSLTKQLKCDDILVKAGVMIKDPNDPNRLAIGVNAMIEYITNEDTTKLKKSTKTTKEEAKLAKIAGMKNNFKKAVSETDLKLRDAYYKWIESLVDANASGTAKYNCVLTKAAVELFVRDMSTIPDSAERLRAIEIATVNQYKNAQWAIEKLQPSKYSTRPNNPAINLPEQKIATTVSEEVFF